MFRKTKRYFAKKYRELLKSHHTPKDTKYRKGALATYTRWHGVHWRKLV